MYSLTDGVLARCDPCGLLTYHVDGVCQKELMPEVKMDGLDKYFDRKDMLATLPKTLARAKRALVRVSR
jgi:hypothetical protein